MADASLSGFITAVTRLLKLEVIPLLFALATVIFIWGVIQYVIGAQGNDAKLLQGKKAILWGIIGMTIMVSAWAIVGILCSSFVQWGGTGTCPSSIQPFSTLFPTTRI